MPADAEAQRRPQAPTFAQALAFWLKLGFISFGGPAGQIAVMHQELVEQRRWISERRFLHALNYCMLLPGPEAQQLATYIGWLFHRTWGGIVAGALFVLPSLLISLSWIYVAYGSVPAVAGVLYESNLRSRPSCCSRPIALAPVPCARTVCCGALRQQRS
jgi:chromate transporter